MHGTNVKRTRRKEIEHVRASQVFDSCSLTIRTYKHTAVGIVLFLRGYARGENNGRTNHRVFIDWVHGDKLVIEYCPELNCFPVGVFNLPSLLSYVMEAVEGRKNKQTLFSNPWTHWRSGDWVDDFEMVTEHCRKSGVAVLGARVTISSQQCLAKSSPPSMACQAMREHYLKPLRSFHCQQKNELIPVLLRVQQSLH